MHQFGTSGPKLFGCKENSIFQQNTKYCSKSAQSILLNCEGRDHSLTSFQFLAKKLSDLAKGLIASSKQPRYLKNGHFHTKKGTLWKVDPENQSTSKSKVISNLYARKEDKIELKVTF